MADEPSKENQDPTELATRVREVLELMRPMIQEDDGDIEFVGTGQTVTEVLALTDRSALVDPLEGAGRRPAGSSAAAT